MTPERQSQYRKAWRGGRGQGIDGTRRQWRKESQTAAAPNNLDGELCPSSTLDKLANTEWHIRLYERFFSK